MCGHVCALPAARLPPGARAGPCSLAHAGVARTFVLIALDSRRFLPSSWLAIVACLRRLVGCIIPADCLRAQGMAGAPRRPGAHPARGKLSRLPCGRSWSWPLCAGRPRARCAAAPPPLWVSRPALPAAASPACTASHLAVLLCTQNARSVQARSNDPHPACPLTQTAKGGTRNAARTHCHSQWCCGPAGERSGRRRQPIRGPSRRNGGPHGG